MALLQLKINMADSKLNAIYLRFSNLKQAIEGVTGAELVDEIEQKLLDLVASSRLRDETWTVTGLMESGLASPATVHKRLKHLVKLGLLRIEPTDQYPRKDVLLTDKAVDYYNRLAEAMKNAVLEPK